MSKKITIVSVVLVICLACAFIAFKFNKKSIVKSKRKKFKASTAFASLYPDGLTTSYQGVPINILFNNTVWDFPECITDYLEDKVQKKADKEAEKLHQFNTKTQELIGEYDAGE
jgi:hypothetical protein